MSTKKGTTRNAERRAMTRDALRLARDRERLFRLERGGSSERPIDVVSASVVEAHARSVPCPHCQSPLRIEDHAVESSRTGTRLRVVHAICTMCGVRRSIYFRLAPALPS